MGKYGICFFNMTQNVRFARFEEGFILELLMSSCVRMLVFGNTIM